MSSLPVETLTQRADFVNPNIIDVYAFDKLFDSNGLPYLAFAPSDYHPQGPQMTLGEYPVHDVTNRRSHSGIVNMTERRSAQKAFGSAMDVLHSLRSAFVMADYAAEDPFTNSNALKLSHMGIELPRYLFWKQNSEHQNGELPPEAVLLNRALRGFHALITRMAWGNPPSREERQRFLQSPFSPEEVKERIVEKKALEGVLVCAANWSMIIEMINVIGGKPASKITSAPIGFRASELIDFSKALRSFWDVVYPGIEHAVGVLTRLETTGGTQQEQHDAEETLEYSIIMANMANGIVSRVIGEEVRELSLDEVAISMLRYDGRKEDRDATLGSAIETFKKQKSSK